ncbi:MAG TPA: vWA domain-containing protein [Planctomycetota bacterium]|nr:vWA domain-containing protein [Planctomycetota bacterium]
MGRLKALAFGSLGILAAGCDPDAATGPSRDRSGDASGSRRPASSIRLPEVDPRLCVGVAILVDTSSSMQQQVRDSEGRKRPKEEIAREALERIIKITEEWQAAHADSQLELGIFKFASDVSVVFPMGPFDAEKTRANLGRLHASSGTAIGRALESAFKQLCASGCVRKHILCITDGENTSGPSPEQVAQAYFEATQGEVAIHFVAFDTSASKFRFLERVNGSAVEAADGGQLQSQLTQIYEKQILAEAMPAERD